MARYIVKYKLDGREFQRVSATYDKSSLRRSLGALHKCEGRKIEFTSIEWASFRTIHTD